MERDFETQIPQLLARDLVGEELDHAQRATISEWLAADPHNRELYEKMTSGDSMECYVALRQGRYLARVERLWHRRRIARWAAVSTAAAMAAVVMLVVRPANDHAVLLSERAHKAVLTVANHTVELSEADEASWTAHVPVSAETSIVKVEVPRGGEYRLRLLDGTRVWLNSGSSIEYPEAFGAAERRVSITGELFFDVAHDSEHPFVVATSSGADIMVRGTRFNVRSGTTASVALVEGVVDVSAPNCFTSLSPGWQATFEGGAIAVSQVDDMREMTAWVDGRFYYRGESLDRIFAAIEQWYDIEILFNIDDARRVGNVTFISSRSKTLGEVLESLRHVTGMSYTTRGETITILL